MLGPPGAKQPALRCPKQKPPQSHRGFRPQKNVTKNREGWRKRPAQGIPLELGDIQELGSGVPLLKTTAAITTTTTGRGHGTTRSLWVSVRLDPELEGGGSQGRPLVQWPSGCFEQLLPGPAGERHLLSCWVLRDRTGSQLPGCPEGRFTVRALRRQSCSHGRMPR